MRTRFSHVVSMISCSVTTSVTTLMMIIFLTFLKSSVKSESVLTGAELFSICFLYSEVINLQIFAHLTFVIRPVETHFVMTHLLCWWATSCFFFSAFTEIHWGSFFIELISKTYVTFSTNF